MNKFLAIIVHIIFSAAIIAGVFGLEKTYMEFTFFHKLCDGFFVSSVALFAYYGFYTIIKKY